MGGSGAGEQDREGGCGEGAELGAAPGEAGEAGETIVPVRCRRIRLVSVTHKTSSQPIARSEPAQKVSRRPCGGRIQAGAAAGAISLGRGRSTAPGAVHLGGEYTGEAAAARGTSHQQRK